MAMSNWKLRLGSALSGLGLSIAGVSLADAKHATEWTVAGLLIGAAGHFWKTLFPETDGGQKASDQLPATK
jgi:hypothetical protein